MASTLMLIVLTGISIFFLIRSALIMFGYLKEPILRTFEEYGPQEKLYLPLLPILAWSSAVALAASLWATRFPNLSFTLSILGVLLLLAAGLGYNNREWLEKYHFKLLKLPTWYHELRDRTTRYERRRIAYMWLHLPFRARLTYNSSNRLFFIWADFIIMGTVREEEPTGDDEPYFFEGR